jgi:hypothetical protein
MQLRTAALFAGLVMALTACADKSQTPVTPETSPAPRFSHSETSCDGHDSDYDDALYIGTLSGSGDYDIQPCGTYYWATAGRHTGLLPSTQYADFDLYLYKWNGSSWSLVASSTSAGGYWEQVGYTGTQGYYFWEIYSYSGAGDYQFTMTHP